MKTNKNNQNVDTVPQPETPIHFLLSQKDASPLEFGSVETGPTVYTTQRWTRVGAEVVNDGTSGDWD